MSRLYVTPLRHAFTLVIVGLEVVPIASLRVSSLLVMIGSPLSAALLPSDVADNSEDNFNAFYRNGSQLSLEKNQYRSVPDMVMTFDSCKDIKGVYLAYREECPSGLGCALEPGLFLDPCPNTIGA